MKRNQAGFDALAALHADQDRATRVTISALLPTLRRAVALGVPGMETDALLAVLESVAAGSGAQLIDAALTRADLADLPADSAAAEARAAVVTAASAAMVGLGMVSSSLTLPAIAAWAAEAAASVHYIAGNCAMDMMAAEERRQVGDIITAAYRA